MSKTARSARGELVDFDILAITAAIAKAPAPGIVQARREFIDEKDGLRSRARQDTVIQGVKIESVTGEAVDAMALAFSAMNISANSVEDDSDLTE